MIGGDREKLEHDKRIAKKWKSIKVNINEIQS